MVSCSASNIYCFRLALRQQGGGDREGEGEGVQMVRLRYDGYEQRSSGEAVSGSMYEISDMRRVSRGELLQCLLLLRGVSWHVFHMCNYSL
jgi:hypothetical protein